MKKAISLILVFILIMTFTACQTNTPAGSTASPSTEEGTDTPPASPPTEEGTDTPPTSPDSHSPQVQGILDNEHDEYIGVT